MKHTMLLFSKLPEVGRVKTRLTTLKDGTFPPEVACDLFRAMLLDVVAISLSAFNKLERTHPEDEFELVVSVAPAANVEAMRTLFEAEGIADERLRFITDAGSTFDEHYNDAFAQCFASGSDTILSMGADMPALTEADVIRGFEALILLGEEDKGGIVLAPDQEMGVSIVGWTRRTPFDHTGVFYNQTGLTVLPAYIEKAKAAHLPALYLPPVPDVDTIADLMHTITLVGALMYTSRFDDSTPPAHTATVLREIGCEEVRIPPNDLVDPRDAIDVI